MRIIRTFNDMESIAQALDLMLNYPFYERPLLMIKFQDFTGATPKFMEGTLDYVSRSMIVIRSPYCSENDYVLLGTIVDLHIYDEGVY